MLSGNKKSLIFAETNKKTCVQRLNRRITAHFSMEKYSKRKDKYQEMYNV